MRSMGFNRVFSRHGTRGVRPNRRGEKEIDSVTGYAEREKEGLKSGAGAEDLSSSTIAIISTMGTGLVSRCRSAVAKEYTSLAVHEIAAHDREKPCCNVQQQLI